MEIKNTHQCFSPNNGSLVTDSHMLEISLWVTVAVMAALAAPQLVAQLLEDLLLPELNRVEV